MAPCYNLMAVICSAAGDRACTRGQPSAGGCLGRSADLDQGAYRLNAGVVLVGAFKEIKFAPMCHSLPNGNLHRTHASDAHACAHLPFVQCCGAA